MAKELTLYGLRKPRVATPNDGRPEIMPNALPVVTVEVEKPRIAWWFAPSDAETAALLASGRAGDYLRGVAKEAIIRRELLKRTEFGARAIARYRNVAPPSFATALDTGTVVSEQIGSMAAAAGPVGSAVGAIGGLLGGIVLGVIPFARNEAEDSWRRFTAQLQPIDRYAILSQLRFVAVRNAREERKVFPGGTIADPTGPWRWADDPPLGHSPWGGPVGRTVNLVEILAEKQMVPDSCATDTTSEKRFVALYLVLALGGAHDDDKRPENMRELWPRFENGTISPIHQPYFMELKTRTFGELRANAPTQGLRSIWNPPITPGIERAIKDAR